MQEEVAVAPPYGLYEMEKLFWLEFIGLVNCGIIKV